MAIHILTALVPSRKPAAFAIADSLAGAARHEVGA